MLPKLALKCFKKLCNQSILQAFFWNLFYQELEIQKQIRNGPYVTVPVGGKGGEMSRSDDGYII